MELRQLQRAMQSGLLEGQSAIEAHIADTPPLTKEARLGIYRHAYVARLIEALRNYYPVLYQILGDEDFEALGAAFVRTHPSVHRSIRWYGQEVAAFLRVELPFAEQPILAEIARFEWRLAESFDSADAVVLDRAALASVEPAEWADLTFRFHPSVQRLTLEWNTVAVWKAISAEEAPPRPSARPTPSSGSSGGAISRTIFAHWIPRSSQHSTPRWRGVTSLRFATRSRGSCPSNRCRFAPPR